jgi:hypothetical protein
LPFDVNVIRTIRFSRSDVGLINARDELIEILEAGLAGDFDPVTATRVWCEEGELREDPEEPPSTDGVGTAGFQPDAEGEDGFLDVMVEAEERQEELAPALEAVGARIIELGGLAESATNEMSKSDAAGKGMRGRLQIATKYADGVDRLATELDAEVDRYAAVLSSVSAGNLALIAALEEDPAALDDPAAREFGMTLRGVARISRESLGDLDGLVASINDNARLSRVLKEPTNRLTAALQRFVSVTSTIDEWDRRLQSLGIPMPPEDWEPQDEAGEEAVSAGDEESAPDPQGAPHPGGDDAPEPDPRGEAHRDDGEPGSSEKTD